MDDDSWIMLPEYPIINNTFVDSLIPHPQILGGLGMDFDGDTASSNGVLSKQANQEVNEYLDSVGRYIHSNGKLMHGTTDLIKLTIFNLSRDPVLV